ncbi:MAG: hypothetical protein KDC07_07875, partial [Chitinophagaceae bacterium]|nr:hypothetical protein [Chitinophagaceae bacterium]
EGNVFKNMNYIFSTGGFFDSLMIAGTAYEAVTGKPAGSDINIVLYDARRPDSAIVREKPEYVVKVKDKGHFILPGLPGKSFRIYALKDDNDNLIYDGTNERIAFIDSIIFPADTIGKLIELRLFKEIAPLDTAKDADSVKTNMRERSGKRRGMIVDSKDFRYSVGVDTSNKDKRTHDLNKPVKISFGNTVDTYDIERISLSLDSSDTLIPFTITRDTLPNILFMDADWKENTLYTIKLLKDFAEDTSGQMATPSKHMFRTKGEEDYGILITNVPSVYLGKKYRLVVTTEKDTLYNKPVTDTIVQINRLLPEKYSLSIIVDENENGIWDTGNLFEKIQPELVIPHTDVIDMKAGWEIVVDFVMPVTEGQSAKTKIGAPPVRGDRPGAK